MSREQTDQTFQIREMRHTDLDSVVRIYSEVYSSSYIAFSELAEGKAEALNTPSAQAAAIFQVQLADLLQKAQPGLFVICLGKDTIGFAFASLRRTEAGHLECWLDDLGVSFDYRRRGVAKKLVCHVLDWGTKAGASYFLLESGVKNESAHQLFEQLGFQPLCTVFWRDHN